MTSLAFAVGIVLTAAPWRHARQGDVHAPQATIGGPETAGFPGELKKLFDG